MIYDRQYNEPLRKHLSYFPVAGLVGPRQVGKKTFVREILRLSDEQYIYLDLEMNSDLRKMEDPELFLSENRNKLVVIDEIQHRRDLFPLLRALIDKDYRPGRFILLG
jgi:predicted AAA+ superfamily ATPase